MSAYSLMAYCLGLPAFILIKILANGFYARQDTKTPVRIGIQSMVLNMVMNVVFVVSMLQNDFIAPHVGLALATTTSAYFNALMLAMKLRQSSIIESFSDYSLPLLRILIACCVMAALIVLMMPSVEAWTNWEWFERTYHLAQIIVPAGLCYVLMLWIIGFRRNHFVL